MDQPLFIYADYPESAAVTLSNAAAGQYGTDMLQANEDTYVSPAATALTITIDLLAPVSCGCLAVAGENLHGVSLELRASTDNFVSSNVLVSAVAPLYGYIAAWRPFATVSYRYYRVSITGATTDTRIYHLALAPLLLLPYMADGADLDAFQSTANHVLSPQGHFLASQLMKTERKIPLGWGQVMEDEYQLFLAWSAACVANSKAFFFVPDAGVSTCYFGHTDANYTFSAPMKGGLRNMAKIPFTSRFA